MLCTAPAFAQVGVGERPGDQRPELEDFAPDEPEAAPTMDLPPLPDVPEGELESLSTGSRVFVQGFEVEGSSVFSTAELEAVTAPYSGRAISQEELIEVRDAIGRLYVDHGYITSGAVIPDQTLEQGIVRIEVAEGVLAEVRVTGTRRFRPGYFERRLKHAAGVPVNLGDLESALQRLQRDKLVSRVHASLLPGERRGESVLLFRVEENSNVELSANFSNQQPPSIGSYAGEGRGSYANLLGIGDEWSVRFQGTEGLVDMEFGLETPFTRFDTRLLAWYRRTESEIVEDPFDALDVKSEASTIGVGIGQPLFRSRGQELWFWLIGERRHSESTLLGEDLCLLPDPELTKCDSDVSALRVRQDWTYRARNDVVAARSTLTVGLPVLGASDRVALPDGRYFAWLAQLQWAHRFPEWLLGTQVVVRVDAQLATDDLLAIEKFAVGGMYSVRGYRENTFVADNGTVASLELQIPVWRESFGRPLVALVPFGDLGTAWNHQDETHRQTIGSVGIGLRVSPWRWLNAEAYWGHRLDKIPNPHDDPQDEGFHFRLSVTPLAYR
jgi:hemolysin activation/secretion protein